MGPEGDGGGALALRLPVVALAPSDFDQAITAND